MTWEIIIGNKRDNIFASLKKSHLARLVLILCCISAYQSRLGRESDGVIGLVVVGMLGAVMMNCLYIPLRMLGHKKTDEGLKLGVILIFAVAAVWNLNYAVVDSLADILIIFVRSIIISLAGIGIGAGVWKILAVHFQREKTVFRQREFDSMDGWEFEEFCADVLRKNGFERVTVTSGSGDYGIDVIAYRGHVKYGIQCKRYAGTVGWHAVEEARAGAEYWRCQRAVVLTNSKFTKQALEGAGRIGVELWDREWLMNNL